MFNWLKRLWYGPIPRSLLDVDNLPPLKKPAPKKRPRLYKQATVVTTGELPKEKKMATKPGLYANIHKKQERIAKQKAEGKPVEKMRKPGTKGAPTAAAFKAAAKTAKAK